MINDPVDLDLEFLYRSINGVTEAQEDAFIARVRELVVDSKLCDTVARIKALNEIIR